jgi:DNA mismatch repair protein MutL
VGLTTFGFRGEALPSIAAVSRLTLRTKRPGSQAGFSLGYEAGMETSSGDVGMPDGTQIEVRDLFWNTPARLKFMKSEATEAANVAEAVIRLALAHPEIHFRLRGNGRVVLDLPPHRDMAERVRAALARRGASLLHEAQGEEAGVVVRAFLAAPEEASATPRSTFMFVAKRFVRDRSLLHALGMGYGELLEKGRYPMAALFVDVPGQELDVNVHPQKLEVRFARPQEVYGAVRHVVGAAVARAPWLPPAPLRAYTSAAREPGCARGRRGRGDRARAWPSARVAAGKSRCVRCRSPGRAGSPTPSKAWSCPRRHRGKKGTKVAAERAGPSADRHGRLLSAAWNTSDRSTAPTSSARAGTSWSSWISTRPTSA